jgi:hypothetical protein
MPSLDLKKLNKYRAQTYRLSPFSRVSSPKAALDFVNARGFIYFWPIKGIELRATASLPISMMTPVILPGVGRIMRWVRRNGTTQKSSGERQP